MFFDITNNGPSDYAHVAIRVDNVTAESQSYASRTSSVTVDVW